MSPGVPLPAGAGGVDREAEALYGEIVHTVEYSDDTDDADRWCEVVESAVREVLSSDWLAKRDAVVVAALAAAERERDLAIAHDTQPYPTAWAYEQACRVMHEAKAEADDLRARLAAAEQRAEALSTVVANVRALADEWRKDSEVSEWNPLAELDAALSSRPVMDGNHISIPEQQR